MEVHTSALDGQYTMEAVIAPAAVDLHNIILVKCVPKQGIFHCIA